MVVTWSVFSATLGARPGSVVALNVRAVPWIVWGADEFNCLLTYAAATTPAMINIASTGTGMPKNFRVLNFLLSNTLVVVFMVHRPTHLPLSRTRWADMNDDFDGAEVFERSTV